MPPELLLGGLGLGELYVARYAGSMALDSATIGTIEYGSGVLGVPLIILIGHDHCGAVTAACEVVEKNTTFPAYIGPMDQDIVAAAKAAQGKPGDFVDNAVRESTTRTATRIATQSNIVAGRYDLEDGRVEFLSLTIACRSVPTKAHLCDPSGRHASI